MAKKERRAAEKEIKVTISQRKKERKKKMGERVLINNNHIGYDRIGDMRWLGGVLYFMDDYSQPTVAVPNVNKLPKNGKEAIGFKAAFNKKTDHYDRETGRYR